MLDLGANVGSFARMAAPVLGPRGRIYAVEPIADVYAALALNAGVYKAWAAKHKLAIAEWVCVHAGMRVRGVNGLRWSLLPSKKRRSNSLGGTRADDTPPPTPPQKKGVGAAGGPPSRDFTYYPRLSAMSSMYPDDADAAAATCSLVVNRPQSFSALEDVGKALARCWPRGYALLHRAAFTALLLRPARRVACPMTTVSGLIEAHQIKEVGVCSVFVFFCLCFCVLCAGRVVV